jgi:hypothetical protein
MAAAPLRGHTVYTISGDKMPRKSKILGVDSLSVAERVCFA